MPTIDKTGIQTNQTITAAQILGIIEALDGTDTTDIILDGDTTLNGTTTFTNQVNIAPSQASTGTNVLTVDGSGRIFKTGSYGTGGSVNVPTLQEVTDQGSSTDNSLTITGSITTTANANISGFITVGDSNLRLRESPASFGLPPTGILQSDSRFRVADDLEASNISGSTVTLMIDSGSSVQNFGVSGAYQVSWDATVTQNFFEDDFLRLNWNNSGQYSLAIMQDPDAGKVNIINNEEGTYTHFNVEAASGGVVISEILENSSNSTTLKAPMGGTSFPFYKILIVHSDVATYGDQNMYAVIEKLIN